MTMGNAGDHPLAPSAAPPEARHFGAYAGLIDEHDITDLTGVRQQPSLAFAPNRPRRLDIAALLFTGVCGFF
jgi:hypothetical protein